MPKGIFFYIYTNRKDFPNDLLYWCEDHAQFLEESKHYEEVYHQKKPIKPLTKQQIAAIPKEDKHDAVMKYICVHIHSAFDGRCCDCGYCC